MIKTDENDGTGDLISVIDIANHYGKHKQSIFKVLKRLGIEPRKLRSTHKRGQLISYITNDEYRRLGEELSLTDDSADSGHDMNHAVTDALLGEEGVFYLLLLEPDHDPGRFKIGFAQSFPERLRALRCSAPFAKLVKTWPCKRLWEKTAIECVADGCDRLHTEVFRTDSIESVLAKCEQFFDLMPQLRDRRRE
jgi:hypothetical protein